MTESPRATFETVPNHQGLVSRAIASEKTKTQAPDKMRSRVGIRSEPKASNRAVPTLANVRGAATSSVACVLPEFEIDGVIYTLKTRSSNVDDD